MTLHIGEDNNVYWRGLQRESDGEYVNDATVTFTVRNSQGIALTGAEDVTLVNVAGSDGDYIGVLDAGVPLEERTHYLLELTALVGSSKGFRRIPCVTVLHSL